MQRRSFLGGLSGILAAGFAPAAVGSGVLMPVKKIQRLPWTILEISEITAHNPKVVKLFGDDGYIPFNARDSSKINTRHLIIRDLKGNILFSSTYDQTDPESYTREINRGLNSPLFKGQRFGLFNIDITELPA